MTSAVPDLDALLVAAASSQGDPATVTAFTDGLLAATVGWLLARGPEGQLAPVTVPVRDTGSSAVPFFSTPDKAQEALRAIQRPGVELVEQPIAARELFAQAVRNNVPTALNPRSTYGKSFTVPEMSDLLAGITPGTQTRVAPAGTQMLVGAPAHIEPGLVEGLVEYLRGLGRVDAATLAWVQYPDGLQGYLLVVRTSLPRETVNAGIDGPASNTGGRTLDVLVVGPGEKDLAAGVAPFYPPPSST